MDMFGTRYSVLTPALSELLCNNNNNSPLLHQSVQNGFCISGSILMEFIVIIVQYPQSVSRSNVFSPDF